MSLLVCYGGTFDPVHNGHLAIARAARDALDASVRLLPAADPPHKNATHADAAQRARMLEIAVAGEPGLKVDRRELGRDGPSYTVDTLRALRGEFGADRAIGWLVGADSLAALDTWHAWRDLFSLAHLLVVRRAGDAPDASWLAARSPTVAAEVSTRWRAAADLDHAPAGGLAVLPLAEPRPESSTELRRRIRAGEPWRDWTAPAVAAYIEHRQLYGARGGDRATTSPPL